MKHSMIMIVRGSEEEAREAGKQGRRAFWGSVAAGGAVAILLWVVFFILRSGAQ